ncbi:MAG: hypothetical protein VX015_10145 [Planctomycetota bacterium]|nr:hypothetical protein [Planctomycetota bacterium]
MTRPILSIRAAAAVLFAAGLGVLPGCYIDTQRYPGMMRPSKRPLPSGARDSFGRGPEEAYVVRHSDLVSVRKAETMQTVALRWYDRSTEAPAGSWIYTGPKGFAEVLLPGATEVQMRGNCAGVVGSESRREPIFTFVSVVDASVRFGEFGRVQLPGGALLEADNGLFVLEMVDPRVLRVANRSGRPGTVAYREELLQLKPSETVDLALLDVGTAPFEVDPDTRDVVTDGGRVQLRGDVDVLASGDGARMLATGESEIRGYGQVIRLDPGDEILLESLGSAEERPAAVETP